MRSTAPDADGLSRRWRPLPRRIREDRADMYRPRRVSLTETERRKLRAIEEALAADDPALAGLLDGTIESTRSRRRTRRMGLTYIVSAVVLLVLGMLTADPGLLSLALVLLVVAPLVVMCIAGTMSRWPPSEGWKS
jgi:Protein of unknown function (DUF3040)